MKKLRKKYEKPVLKKRRIKHEMEKQIEEIRKSVQRLRIFGR